MRKKGFIWFISIIVLLFLAGGFYVGLARYYADGFSYGTWINEIYCTGKSVEEVDAELKSSFVETEITLHYDKDVTETILLSDISFSIDYREKLQDFRSQQNPYLWADNFLSGNGHSAQMVPSISFDEAKLAEEVGNLPSVRKEEQQSKRRVEIVKTENGYQLVDEKKHILDAGMLLETVKAALLLGKFEVDVEETCYKDLKLTAEEKEEVSLWEKIRTFQDCGILYDMGEKIIPVDASVVCDWIKLDEAGEFLLDETGNLITDEEKIKEFIDELADEYDTVGADRSFQATRGEEVIVSGGNYGNKLDKKAEVSYLTESFQNKVAEVHIPKYTQQALVRGKNDIGNTYIEIDMTEQMMYYYVDGELYVGTKVVTGNTGRRMGTPEGTCYVYGKQKSRVLRGENYASFVNFWVPVRGNIGIHDAPWRSEYGGEIYKTNGSHGCINTPYEEMEKIYDHVEIGTPVVMFY